MSTISENRSDLQSSEMPPRPGALRTLQENVQSALRALTLNWLHSVLTVTGVVIGATSVITLVAILQGVKAEIAKQVEGLGANLVLVVPSKLDENGQVNPGSMIGISSLSDADVAALKRVPGVAAISPISIVSGMVENHDGTLADAFVVATNRAGVQMNPCPLVEGRYFTDSEPNACVLSDKPRRTLFPNRPAVGQTVRIQQKDWKVVGVLGKPDNDDSLGHALLGLSTLVYLPIAAVRRELPGGQINRIALKTDYQHPADAMIAGLNKALLNTHNNREDFGVITQKKGLALVFKLVNMAQALLVLIAAISLFVAGVGIMNIMLVTVTDRTREIGIRKTVGARRADIFQQFLTEAITLSLLGGGIGLLLSQALCTLIARFAPLTPHITPGAVFMALGLCVGVGLVFGVTPAIRASRLDPIEALRHE